MGLWISLLKNTKTASDHLFFQPEPEMGKTNFSLSEEDKASFIWNMRLLLQLRHPTYGGWPLEDLENSLGEDYHRYFGKFIEPKLYKEGATTWRQVFETRWFQGHLKVRSRSNKSALVDEAPREKDEFVKIASMASYESCRASSDPVIKMLLKLPAPPSKQDNLEDQIAERVKQINNYDIKQLTDSPDKSRAVKRHLKKKILGNEMYSQIIKKDAFMTSDSDTDSDTDSEPKMKKSLLKSAEEKPKPVLLRQQAIQGSSTESKSVLFEGHQAFQGSATEPKRALLEHQAIQGSATEPKRALLEHQAIQGSATEPKRAFLEHQAIQGSSTAEPKSVLLGHQAFQGSTTSDPKPVSSTPNSDAKSTEVKSPNAEKDQSQNGKSICMEMVPFTRIDEGEDPEDEKADQVCKESSLKCVEKGTDTPSFEIVTVQQEKPMDYSTNSLNLDKLMFNKHDECKGGKGGHLLPMQDPTVIDLSVNREQFYTPRAWDTPSLPKFSPNTKNKNFVVNDATNPPWCSKIQTPVCPDRCFPFLERKRDIFSGLPRSPCGEDSLSSAAICLYNCKTRRPYSGCINITLMITCFSRVVVADDLHNVFSEFGHVSKAKVISALLDDRECIGQVELLISGFSNVSDIIQSLAKKCIVQENNGNIVFSFEVKVVKENEGLPIFEPATEMSVNYELHPRYPDRKKFDLLFSMKY